jgi:hypothetical protein
MISNDNKAIVFVKKINQRANYHQVNSNDHKGKFD